MRSVQKLKKEKLILKIKKEIEMYAKQNKEKINKYKINRYKTDNIFQLVRQTKIRIYKALKRTSKSSSTMKILGIDIETY